MFLIIISIAFKVYRRRRGQIDHLKAQSQPLQPNDAKELHGEHLRELEVPPAELKAGARYLSAELPGDEIRFASEVMG